ncbi:hypothetical protein Misp01_30060 [Microtetraspora sp. NBRC 13810]|uniref:hypothetical protein n=1 Tax=Microtetraspora sp. NBRC 13810 TaxID=3030990 RepID=UPI0024A09EF1|nr:hypothetical protein [Microtetraspora sp. NBRC 13810]GLW07876.1 hypothetical protein Misp01_30060 [Microtetraspora sp. NBRC 13810]
MAVKILTPVQPAPVPGLPITPVEFDGMTITPYAAQATGRLAYSIRATGMRSPRTASAAPTKNNSASENDAA